MLSAAVQESMFLKQLLDSMLENDIKDVFIHSDNKGSIDLAKNPVHHKRSKHIDIRHHFIREHVRNGDVELIYIPSGDNCADVFTKAVPKGNFTRFNLIE